MKIPKQIQIAGKIYEIVYDENIYTEEHRNGEITYNNQKIKLYKNATKQTQEETFCHELVHGIFNVFNIEINREDVVIPFGELLYQVLKQLELKD